MTVTVAMVAMMMIQEIMMFISEASDYVVAVSGASLGLR